MIKNEEERFHETLHEGLAILEKIIDEAVASGKETIDGADVFRLYDTYGFPVDLTEEYAQEKGLEIDREGFEEAMEGQRTRARSARQESGSMQVQDELLGQITVESSFVGYDKLATEAKIEVMIHNKERAAEVQAGQTVQLILNETPFYAESGGQVADKGIIRGEEVLAEVTDVSKAPNGQHLHTCDG